MRLLAEWRALGQATTAAALANGACGGGGGGIAAAGGLAGAAQYAAAGARRAWCARQGLHYARVRQVRALVLAVGVSSRPPQ